MLGKKKTDNKNCNKLKIIRECEGKKFLSVELKEFYTFF